MSAHPEYLLWFRIVFFVLAFAGGLGGVSLAIETQDPTWWWVGLGAVVFNLWFAALSYAVGEILRRLASR